MENGLSEKYERYYKSSFAVCTQALLASSMSLNRPNSYQLLITFVKQTSWCLQYKMFLANR